MSLDASLVPATLLNAQRIMALPENPDHLPAVDWKNLGAPDNRTVSYTHLTLPTIGEV